MGKHADLTLSRMEACLTALGSETLDTNLCIVYSKLGLDITAVGKFAKQNCVENNNNVGKTKTETK